MCGYEDEHMHKIDAHMPHVLEPCRCDISHISFGAQHEDGFFGDRHSGSLRNAPATILTLDKHAVAKRLKSSDSEAIDVFYWHATSLQACDHPSIVPLLGVCVEGDDRRIVLEACDDDLASNLARDLPATTVWRWALELADGLRYLHANQRVLASVTVDNVVLDRSSHAQWASVGPLAHTARAALKSGDLSAATTTASDIFAFGELMFSMCRGHPDGAADREWPLAELIRRCRVADESARPTASQLVMPRHRPRLAASCPRSRCLLSGRLLSVPPLFCEPACAVWPLSVSLHLVSLSAALH